MIDVSSLKESGQAAHAYLVEFGAPFVLTGSPRESDVRPIQNIKNNLSNRLFRALIGRAAVWPAGHSRAVSARVPTFAANGMGRLEKIERPAARGLAKRRLVCAAGNFCDGPIEPATGEEMTCAR